MTESIKVSKQNVDVLTATDPNDFIFESNLNTFKILASGTTGGTITSNPTTFTVAHGQADPPAFYAFARFPDGYVALPNEKERADAHPVERYWNCECDGTNVYFIFYKGASNYSGTVRYYIFESTL